MKRRALVAFPSWDEASRLRVESVRAQHDPGASRIQAHFTLVFPTRMAAEVLNDHVVSVLEGHAPFAFTIGRAVAVADSSASNSYVFLVPDEGGDDLVALHGRLYTGVLGPHLRTDLPFLPHITVAAHPRLAESRALVDRLDRDGVRVHGTVERLHLVEVDEAGTRMLAQFDLRSRPSTTRPPDR